MDIKNNTKFTIIIPTYNSSSFIERCLNSLCDQNYSKAFYEVLIIDDASSDNTVNIVKTFEDKFSLKIFKLENNGGPGIARNTGIDNASHEWILFLDSDDFVTDDYLSTLDKTISNDDSSLMAVGFNWSRESHLEKESRKDFNVGRSDGKFLLNKNELINNFLSARMDASVIYTAIKKDLIDEHNIRFDYGLHEDIDFIYRVYQYAIKTTYLDKVLYLKKHREDSIINTISIKHLEGYLRAWKVIGEIVKKEIAKKSLESKLLESYYLGLVGVIASRVKEIRRHETNNEKIINLYQFLYETSLKLISIEDIVKTTSKYQTSYCKITNHFMPVMANDNLNLSSKVESILNFVGNLEGKSWSCTDLNQSVFLRSNEINTCCRRFFVDNKREGDVTILEVPKNRQEIVSADKILNAKKELHHKINTGIKNPCDGCPHLEYKEWEPINSLDIRYLSFEYHSVCNLKCTYCSDEYYGGVKSFYNVKKTIQDFYDKKCLDNCHTIVWGGGEPTIGENFEEIVEMLSEMLPNVNHRIVTNAVRISPAVSNLLKENKIQIITSIDSGSKEVYKKVRGKDELTSVLNNLVYYSDINSSAVTVKYLFTMGNGSIDDIEGFVSLIEEYKLNQCLFQISMDFKYEHIDIDFVNNMIILYGLLKKINCKAVYFDEIILQRIRDFNVNSEIDSTKLCNYVGIDFIASSNDYNSVVIWGASQNAKNIIEKSIFFKNVEVDFFIDSNLKKQEEGFCLKNVKAPNELCNSTYPVLITAVQGYSKILEELDKIGYSSENIIDKLII